MYRIKWNFRFLTLLFVLMFIPSLVLADAVDFDNKLSNIKKLEDNSEALLALDKLTSQLTLSPKQQFEVTTTRGLIFYNLGKLNDAISKFQYAIQFAQENALIEEVIHANKNLGIMLYLKGEHKEALKHYNIALEYFTLQNEMLKVAHLYNNIGLSHAALEEMPQALFSYESAEKLYQEHGSETDINDIRYNIAGMHIRLKRYDSAIKILKEVIEKRIEFKDDSDLASAYGNLGVAYKQSGQYQLAKTYLLKSLRFYQTANDLYQSAAQLHNLAELYLELGQPKQAQDYAEQAITLSEQQNHKMTYAGSLQSMALALFYQGDFEQAHDYLVLSNSTALKMGYKEILNTNMGFLSLVYSSQHKFSKAVISYQDYIKEKNEVANENLNEQLARFESKQLKQKILDLKQETSLQKLQESKAEQLRQFIIVISFFVLIGSFFFYRRLNERHAKQELEAKVKQRTKALENTTEELIKANKIKSLFLANMSHEIRTPLTAVVGQAESIINGDIEPLALHKEVEIIYDNSQYLLLLINDILDISKIEAEKLTLEEDSYDITKLLDDLTSMFNEQAIKKGLEFKISHNLPFTFHINIDGLRLKQILINLCSNALKFTLQGKVSLDVTFDNHQLIFSVKDTGIGMSEEQLEHIFDKFTQGDNSTSRRFGGTGLGLFLSKKLASLMEGNISVVSKLDKGSTFTFTLPVEQLDSELNLLVNKAYNSYDSEQDDSTENSVNKGELKPLPKLLGKVLIAEDHGDNRRLIARILRSLGLEVLTACNGREAIDIVQLQNPKLILLDIQMPEMDGIEAINILKKQGCKTPIIALTANAMPHEIAQYIELGFNEHLTKPINRPKFIATIAKYYQDFPDFVETDKVFENVEMSDLVLKFKESFFEEQQTINHLFENNNVDGLIRQIHRLAGAAQMFHFDKLAEKTIKLEIALKAAPTNTVSEEVSELTLAVVDELEWLQSQ